MAGPTLDISSFAQKSGSHAIGKSDISSVDARKALRDMRAKLVGNDGEISSGYLSINTKGDGSINLETRGRHQWGSFHSDKKDATAIVKNLIKEGYGKYLNAHSEAALLLELDKYLNKTGDRIGTQSFVKLIDQLDKYIDSQSAGEKIQAQVKTGVRFEAKFNIRLQANDFSAQAKPQFAKILNLISHDTARFFMHLLTPEVSKALSVKGVNLRTQVVGDADGSISRTILAGINSGHITLEEPELKILAEVMDAEAKASEAYDNRDDTLLEAFQKDEVIANKLEQIIDKAKFKPGNHKLVFIGDILHDRFSNNKQAMKTLIEKLHDQGAVFITGNHDVYDEVNPDNAYQMNEEDRRQHYITEKKRIGQDVAQRSGYEYTSDDEKKDLKIAEDKFTESKSIKLQNGFHAARQITKEDSDQLLEKCFKNAYLDENTSMLYTHNGFQHSGVGNVYMTAFGFIQANNAEELAEKMNACDFNDTTRGYEAIQNEFGDQNFKSQFLEQKNLEKLGILKAPSASEKKVTQDSDPKIPNDVKFRKELDDAGIDKKGRINKTNFRPKDYDMIPQALGVAGKRADGRAVTIVHGHNDLHSQTITNVQNLNARSHQGVSPITKVY